MSEKPSWFEKGVIVLGLFSVVWTWVAAISAESHVISTNEGVVNILVGIFGQGLSVGLSAIGDRKRGRSDV